MNLITKRAVLPLEVFVYVCVYVCGCSLCRVVLLFSLELFLKKKERGNINIHQPIVLNASKVFQWNVENEINNYPSIAAGNNTVFDKMKDNKKLLNVLMSPLRHA